ncbi:MAG: glycosyltransferase [Cytophagales bacterium]|nr:glycosyltransferase [Cytophagales bacterium]
MEAIMSAYNCEPGRGSEFETGWQEMKRMLAKCSRLTVVTRPADTRRIEEHMTASESQRTAFVFFDLPAWVNRLKAFSVGPQIVVYLWEICLFFFLLKQYRRNQFDHAHRATVGSYRFPSFLWYFAPYFTWGPVASGETVPVRLLGILSMKGRVVELLRMLVQRSSLVDPFILLGLYKASEISVATTATLEILPAYARRKAFVRPGYYTIDKLDFTVDLSVARTDRRAKLSLLYVGRLLEWKGIMFVLKALRQLHNRIDYAFTVIGDGPDHGLFRRYAKKHGLNVDFLGKKPRRELSFYYLTHDLFVSPDLHGRGSNTMVEAKLHRLPVLALDITDPDCLTGEELMVIVNTKRKTVRAIVDQIVQVLLQSHNGKAVLSGGRLQSLV